MDIPVHNEIIWRACHVARDRLVRAGTAMIADPVTRFPLLARGSWMNDTNQVTVFTDAVGGGTARVSDRLQAFFAELWRVDLDGVIREMARGDPAVAATAATAAQSASGVRDFGSYLRYDHLDILEDRPGVEYAQNAPDQMAGTVREGIRFVDGRLQDSSVGKSAAERLDGFRLTALGRALHTLGDFFAHTNYVELLLWHLALAGRLDPALVKAFNQPGGLFSQVEGEPFTCPLPLGPEDVPEENAILWYGRSPQETPLVSTVFDTRDTACSLLRLFAEQLEQEGAAVPADDEMNLLLAVFDLPGRRTVEAAWRVYQGARDILEDVGRAARAWLAGQIEELGERDPALAGIAEMTAGLVREYDSAEAGDWARAGRFRYVAHALARDIARDLHGQTPGTKLLPHHTLLAKDHPPATAESRLRYSLACLLATEVAAEVVAWHFSSNAGNDGFNDVKRAWLAHPHEVMSRTPALSELAAARLAGSCYGLSWRRLSDLNPGVLG